jgi:hypothetical protein
VQGGVPEAEAEADILGNIRIFCYVPAPAFHYFHYSCYRGFQASYFSLEREFYDLLPLAFDVFGGAAPTVRRKISSSVLQVRQ